jgi:hypothetical protein
MSIKLKEYLENLNKMVEQNPEILELDVVYAKDDEGNYFEYIGYMPSLGKFCREDCEFISERQFNEFDLDEEEKIVNAICLN